MSPFATFPVWKRIAVIGILFLAIGTCVVFAPATPVVQAQPESPLLPNDNFADASEISELPFSQSTFMDYATTEDGEPFPSCFSNSGYESSAQTVWYRFSPSDELKFAMGRGGWYGPHVVGVYTSDEAMSLVEFNCYWYYPWSTPNQLLTLNPGATYWFQVISWNSEVVEFLLSFLEPLSASINVYPEIPVRGASVIFQAIPEDPSFVSYNFESCEWQFGDGSAATDCNPQHVYVDAGEYTVEVTAYANDGRSATASQVIPVGEPEPPSAWIDFSPTDPAPGDLIVFSASLYDPSGIGFDSNACQWDFGDGTTSNLCWPHHVYSTDSDYTVTLRAYTYDGREATATTVVPVRTHDVSIIKVTVPQSARAGQTRQIVVGVSNKVTPETVQVTLSKGGSNYYDEQIGVLTQLVPVRSGNRTTDFQFSYTFTEQDAAIGKVTFKANAQLVNFRDSYPSDNSYIALPTKVSGTRAGSSDAEEVQPEDGEATIHVYLPAVTNGQ